MHKEVDSYRYVGGVTRRVIKSWVEMDEPQNVPWTSLRKPLDECTVALVSSGGIASKSDRPFNLQIERENPWYSDPSYRTIPRSASNEDLTLYHLHVDSTFFEQDMNCLLPIKRLNELEESGEIGSTATTHYSFMGYTIQPLMLLEMSVPGIIRHLQDEDVDIVILVPA